MPTTVVLATAGYDQTIRLWDASSGKCARVLKLQDKTPQQVNALRITPDKSCVAAALNPQLRLYAIASKSNDPLQVYEGHKDNVTAVGFHKDGRWMYSGSEDGSVKIWDLRAPGSQRDYESRAPVNSVVLHPNQGELISGDHSGTVRVWDLTANKCSTEFMPEGKVPVRSVSVAADASLMVVANNTGNCYMWMPRSSDEYVPLKRLHAHNAHILKCELSPDVSYFATASADKTVKLWNVRDWSLSQTLEGHQRWVWDCVFSADSSFLVTASSDNKARLWELSRGELLRVYADHHKPVVCVALNDSTVSAVAPRPRVGGVGGAGGAGGGGVRPRSSGRRRDGDRAEAKSEARDGARGTAGGAAPPSGAPAPNSEAEDKRVPTASPD